MACKGFDEQVVHQDKRIADLLTNFVCVRAVQANALDLTLFQFDYDLTFAAFLMNADRTIYGRFGSRSHHDNAEKDISLEGFREALAGALELHRAYPQNKQTLGGKQPRPVAMKTPEQYPALAGKYKPTLDYEGAVVRSCLHCHQVREAERTLYRSQRKPIPDEVLLPYPMPDVVGFSVDPKSKARVSAVNAGSAAAQAGLAVSDEILTFAGQPILSTADIQWVLQHTPAPGRIASTVQRGGERRELSLQLPADWRQKNDVSWRATTWDLRRMATGGLVLKEAPEPRQGLGLLVDYVGQYDAHAVGKRAGFRKGDVLVSADGDSKPMTETRFLRQLLQSKLPGEKVPVMVLRSGQPLELQLPMQ